MSPYPGGTIDIFIVILCEEPISLILWHREQDVLTKIFLFVHRSASVLSSDSSTKLSGDVAFISSRSFSGGAMSSNKLNDIFRRRKFGTRDMLARNHFTRTREQHDSRSSSAAITSDDHDFPIKD